MIHRYALLLLFVAAILTLQCANGLGTNKSEEVDTESIHSFTAMADSAWLLSASGQLFRITDDQIIWNELAGTDVPLKCMSFVDRSNGWALGYEGDLWQTLNAGETWRRAGAMRITARSPADSVAQLQFIDQANGWAVGPFSVWKTADVGMSWTSSTPIVGTNRPTSLLRQAHFFDGMEGWVCATGGVLVHTTNGGASWDGLPIASNGSDLTSLAFVGRMTGWVSVLKPGSVYQTIDAGQSWKLLKTFEQYAIRGIYFIDQAQGWAAGNKPVDGPSTGYESQGVLLHTTDGGLTWDDITPEHSQERYYNTVVFSDQRRGWIVGHQDVYRTIDGGNSWTRTILANR